MSYYFLKNKVSGRSDYLLGELATKSETMRATIGSLYEWVSIEDVEKELAQVKAENEELKGLIKEVMWLFRRTRRHSPCIFDKAKDLVNRKLPNLFSPLRKEEEK